MPYTRKDFLIASGMLAGSAVTRLQPGIEKTERSSNQTGDRLVLLGTQGGPFIRSYQQTPSANVIVYKDVPYVIDTGYGVTLKLLEAGIKLASLRYIFITHHHSDHNLELGPLLYNAWVAGLPEAVHVYAPVGVKAMLAAYWESNRIDIETRIKDETRKDIRTLVIAHEYTEGSVLSADGVEVSALRNIHPPVHESYALRCKLGDKIVVFSGDTAYCPALGPFALGADYLVHEVMNGPGVEEMVKRRPNAASLKASILSHHTSAEDAGRIATAANAKCIVLNHFVPPDDKSLTEQVWTDSVRTTFKGKIIVGKDLLQLPL